MGFCTLKESQKFLRGVPLVEKAMVDSGIILLKYWLEVSPEEQERRLEIALMMSEKRGSCHRWTLNPLNAGMTIQRPADEMFAATSMDVAPWYVAISDDKKKVRLNIIRHILKHIPFEELPKKTISLPKRKIKNAQGHLDRMKPIADHYS